MELFPKFFYKFPNRLSYVSDKGITRTKHDRRQIIPRSCGAPSPAAIGANPGAGALRFSNSISEARLLRLVPPAKA